ncbi:dicarboxylate/amino acid:cation symporter [Kordiimonas sp. SCSIO 12610]|uniref:dicarboxylate/amino acid:cation symporter n=1 Tax=Kordiimonas sp. SCSIO 12610 TaxID=2829597 RepID=UPI00210CC9CF|nr:dicarboxylate/amino acid:cation symporter [Kordiimonas sp. SCSIO 12610]UTW56135.1 dicarboxylate/amino acid:cation symporter [Kordiimonas sp. SCSIO 12610]
MLKRWFEIALWKRVLGALVLGIIVGSLWGKGAESISLIGEIFLRLIRMVIVPLIFLTLISGVIAMGDPKKLGSIGIRTLSMYIGTTAVAITIGLIVATIISPGVGVDISGATPKETSDAKSLADILRGIIPENPIQAFADANVLAVIFFSLLFGIGILLAGEKGKPMANVFDSGAEVIIKVTGIVMEFAPFGVFALIAKVTGTQGVAALLGVVPFALSFVIAVLLQIFLVHGAIISFLLKLPPVRFFKGILDAQMVAFSTSSSSATLPVTISVAEHNLGIKPTIAGSVLPLGSTINMDGTAIYVGIAAIFSAQVFGIDLSFADYLLIAFSTTLVSIGTAGIPSASLFLLAAVLEPIGITPDNTALIVGFLFAFDRPLDMLRTVVNITGDLSVSSAVAKWEGELDEETFKAQPVE